MRQNNIHGFTWVDQDWIGPMIFKNFADQVLIGFSFCGLGLDMNWKISVRSSLLFSPWHKSRGGRSHFFRLRLRTCSKIFDSVHESGSGNFSNLKIRRNYRWFEETENYRWFSEMITIRFAGWISSRIVSLQPERISKNCFQTGPDTDKDIRNTFLDISRIQTLGKSCTLHNHLFSIFASIFSAFCAVTPSLSVV